MCFTDAKKKELLERDGVPQKKKELLKLVAVEWRKLSDRERAFWDEEARNDKVRYVLFLKSLWCFSYIQLILDYSCLLTVLSVRRNNSKASGLFPSVVPRSIQELPNVPCRLFSRIHSLGGLK